MTIDSSPTTAPTSSPTPPAVPDVREFTAQHEQLLHSVVTQLSELSERLEALEAQFGATQPSTRAATRATPTWRTKTGRQTGWQPARR